MSMKRPGPQNLQDRAISLKFLTASLFEDSLEEVVALVVHEDEGGEVD